MKLHIALAILTLGVGAASAQTAPLVKVTGAKLQVGAIDTPQFQASNLGDRRWRPKTWLEVDLTFEIKLAQAAGGRRGSLPSMTVNYYIGLAAQTADGKAEVLKGTFNYMDIPANETCHALAYVTPATLRRFFQKEGFTPASDIRAWGFEIMMDGQRIGGDSSTGGTPWWEQTDKLSINDGLMLAKKDTPFSILWGDYDVGVKAQ